MKEKIRFKNLSIWLKIPIISGWICTGYIAILLFFFLIGIIIGMFSVI